GQIANIATQTGLPLSPIQRAKIAQLVGVRAVALQNLASQLNQTGLIIRAIDPQKAREMAERLQAIFAETAQQWIEAANAFRENRISDVQRIISDAQENFNKFSRITHDWTVEQTARVKTFAENAIDTVTIFAEGIWRQTVHLVAF